MDLSQWLKRFKVLHLQARKGGLSTAEGREYQLAREELARALLAAQRLNLQPGQTPRQALRVARALQVELESPVRKDRLTTFDLSLGGFSALVSKAPAADERLTATLRLPGLDPVTCDVTLVGQSMHAGSVRASFAIRPMEGASQERLEMAVFDAVLVQLGQ
jgi:hypothetical protein